MRLSDMPNDYNPNQEREPAGSSLGGQFASVPSGAGGGGGAHANAPHSTGNSIPVNKIDHPAGTWRAEAPKTWDEDKQLMKASYNGSIPDAEWKAVSRYTGSAYLKINQDLRSGKGPNATAKTMDKMFNNVSLSENVVAWRGVDNETFKFLENNVGKTIVDKGYTSVTMDQTTSQLFSMRRKGTSVKVLLPKGSKAFPVQQFSRAGIMEHEILTARGSKFAVGRDKNGLVLTLR